MLLVIIVQLVPLIFGGPNQLDADLEYKLAGGFYMLVFAKLVTVAGCFIYVLQRNLKHAPLLADPRPLSSIDEKVVRASSFKVIVAAVFFSAGWMSFITYGGLLRIVSCGAVDLQLLQSSLPVGFKVSEVARATDANFRSLALGPDNVVVISTRGGSIYAAKWDESAPDATLEMYTIMEGFTEEPNGISYRDSFLYVTEHSKVHSFAWADVLASMESKTPIGIEKAAIVGQYPAYVQHGWRFTLCFF